MTAKLAVPRATRAPARVVLLGAAGRDFHHFNVVYRDGSKAKVVGFTAAQISDIAGRRYPTALAGPLYPDGISIVDEAELEELCQARNVNEVVFACSDVAREQVMYLASRALATGADFTVLGPCAAEDGRSAEAGEKGRDQGCCRTRSFFAVVAGLGPLPRQPMTPP